MNSLRYFFFVFFVSTLSLAACSSKNSSPIESYVAFSLKEAQQLLQAGKSFSDSGLMHLGGITRLVGMVIDRQNQDIIIIGKKISELPSANLEDLVTALKARLIHDELPMVSIDPTPNTAKTGLQQVRFGGHIENTSFGNDFLTCDILLKKYSLELEQQVSNVSSYKKLFLESELDKIKQQGGVPTDIKWINPDSLGSFGKKNLEMENISQTRYWYNYEDNYKVRIRGNVFCIMDLDIIIQNEVINAAGKKDSSASLEKLTPHYQFASLFTDNLYKVSDVHPSIKKLKLLFDMTAIAEGLKNIKDLPDISYLLKEYNVKKVDTKKEFRVIKLCAVITRSDGKTSLVQLSGGIEPSIEVELLNAGDISYLEKIVLESRPDKNSLFWRVPVDNWVMPNSNGITLPKQVKESKSGFSVITNSVVLSNGTPGTNKPTFKSFSTPVRTAEPIQTKGVQMRIVIDSGSFKKEDTLKKLRKMILDR